MTSNAYSTYKYFLLFLPVTAFTLFSLTTAYPMYTEPLFSLQSYAGSVESPRPGGGGGGLHAGGPGNRHLINHLSGKHQFDI